MDPETTRQTPRVSEAIKLSASHNWRQHITRGLGRGNRAGWERGSRQGVLATDLLTGCFSSRRLRAMSHDVRRPYLSGGLQTEVWAALGPPQGGNRRKVMEATGNCEFARNGTVRASACPGQVPFLGYWR